MVHPVQPVSTGPCPVRWSCRSISPWRPGWTDRRHRRCPTAVWRTGTHAPHRRSALSNVPVDRRVEVAVLVQLVLQALHRRALRTDAETGVGEAQRRRLAVDAGVDAHLRERQRRGDAVDAQRRVVRLEDCHRLGGQLVVLLRQRAVVETERGERELQAGDTRAGRADRQAGVARAPRQLGYVGAGNGRCRTWSRSPTLNTSAVVTISVRVRRRNFTHVFCREWLGDQPHHPTSC